MTTSGFDEAGGGIIWPSTLLAEKTRVDAEFQSTMIDVNACKALDNATKGSWISYYTSWRVFYCAGGDGSCSEPDYNLWGLGTQMDELERYEAGLRQWQGKIAASCKLSGPVAPGAPPNVGDQITGGLSLIVWGLAIVAGLYVAHETGILKRGGK